MNDPRPAEQCARHRACRRRARVACDDPRDVRAAAYHVSKADGLIKLDAMENPFALPAALRERLARVLADVPVNRYPDGAATR